ncbi:hypothetical protein JNUCC42_00310 [Brevibacterium sp. JNUCC-42]|nr:hypothetical protein JNUCC42_00310 [Brevibacterium sp. JNUCC-42]
MIDSHDEDGTKINDFKLELVSENGEWFIAKDEYTDNLKEIFGLGTDFKRLGRESGDVKQMSNEANVPQTWEEKRAKSERPGEVSIFKIPGDRWDGLV